eukprot:TRINITY_DN21323_c0_g6_i1.p2 TRINITY_DN21323_c0_g6~~TRINITY_DN21323_c0_g6_i1.p2  ORF type:complete len:230 (+),score=90.66 TRINITY_DN21323_c0_g6_i1:63-692(+)
MRAAGGGDAAGSGLSAGAALAARRCAAAVACAAALLTAPAAAATPAPGGNGTESPQVLLGVVHLNEADRILAARKDPIVVPIVVNVAGILLLISAALLAYWGSKKLLAQERRELEVVNELAERDLKQEEVDMQLRPDQAENFLSRGFSRRSTAGFGALLRSRPADPAPAATPKSSPRSGSDAIGDTPRPRPPFGGEGEAGDSGSSVGEC